MRRNRSHRPPPRIRAAAAAGRRAPARRFRARTGGGMPATARPRGRASWFGRDRAESTSRTGARRSPDARSPRDASADEKRCQRPYTRRRALHAEGLRAPKWPRRSASGSAAFFIGEPPPERRLHRASRRRRPDRHRSSGRRSEYLVGQRSTRMCRGADLRAPRFHPRSAAASAVTICSTSLTRRPRDVNSADILAMEPHRRIRGRHRQWPRRRPRQ